MSNLYALTTEVLSLMDSEDVTDEQLQAAFGNIVDKSGNVCKYIAVLNADSAMFKAEIDRLSARKKAIDNHVARVKEFLQVNMERLDIDTLDAGTFKVSLQKSPPSLVVDDIDKIPSTYMTAVQSFKIQTEIIKDVIKNGGTVPGAHVEQGKHIRIR